MKKILFGLVLAGILFTATCGMAYIIAVGAKYDIGGDLYGGSTVPNSTTPFVWGQSAGNLTPASYPSVHLILGFENGALDIGVGMAGGGIIPISIGGVATYWEITEMFKVYGGGDIVYNVVPNSQGFTYLTLNSKIFGLEISLPLLPFSICAGAGMRCPMVFGPNNYFGFAVGWTVEAGARFYLMK